MTLRVWYPANSAASGTPVTYQSALPGPDTAPAKFSIAGLAIEGAARQPGRFPLAILAHGQSNTPEVLAWLGENLASKGYVVVAPAFGDPPITERASLIFSIVRRPLDIEFVAAEVRRRARVHAAPFENVDVDRVALIGYSMGGYGVITSAGAKLADKQRDVVVPDVKAVVALAPASQVDHRALWAPQGLQGIPVPTLLIAGSQDHVVGYDPGVRSVFNDEINAPRYLLTFREAGHNIGMSGAPPQMRERLWDKDWFEDPVWRKDRLMAIEAHFITAFLDRYVKDDLTKASYIDGLVPNSDDGAWLSAPREYGAPSPGAPATTVWKGFQDRHAAGMTFEFRPAGR